MTARIHLLWDPSRRIEPPPTNVAEQLGLKTAIIDVNDEIAPHEIAKISNDLIKLLLDQIAAGEPN